MKKSMLEALKKELGGNIEETQKLIEKMKEIAIDTEESVSLLKEEFNLRVEKSAKSIKSTSIKLAIVSFILSFIMLNLASSMKLELLLELGTSIMIYIPSSLICCILLDLYMQLSSKRLYILDVIHALSYFICGSISLVMFINNNESIFLSFTMICSMFSLSRIPEILLTYKTEKSFKKMLKSLNEIIETNQYISENLYN